MEWTTPALHEVKMDAEIGSYQEDGGSEREAPVTDRAAHEESPPRD